MSNEVEDRSLGKGLHVAEDGGVRKFFFRIELSKGVVCFLVPGMVGGVGSEAAHDGAEVVAGEDCGVDAEAIFMMVDPGFDVADDVFNFRGHGNMNPHLFEGEEVWFCLNAGNDILDVGGGCVLGEVVVGLFPDEDRGVFDAVGDSVFGCVRVVLVNG